MTVYGSLYSLLKIRTKSAIHGSPPPCLKSVLNRRFVDRCITLQKLHQIGGPWIPIFKIRTDSTRSVEFAILNSEKRNCLIFCRIILVTFRSQSNQNISTKLNSIDSQLWRFLYLTILIRIGLLNYKFRPIDHRNDVSQITAPWGYDF